MKILWVSDSPFFHSAYGLQTRLLTREIVKLGHQVTIFGTTHLGIPMVADGITTLGGFRDPLGNDMLLAHALHVQPDVVITMKDPYLYKPDVMKRLPAPWVPITPVDTTPLDDANRGPLGLALKTIALTRDGHRLIEKAGFQALYAPHAIEPDIFKPITAKTKKAVRANYGIKPDTFMALFVGINNSYPSRKGIDLLLEAWRKFAADRHDVMLWLHTFGGGDLGGIDVHLMLQTLGIDKEQVVITDPYEYINSLTREQMATLYQMSDVLVQPSLGEGFCIPLVEAQACGIPVIATRFGAMEELNFSGWKMEGERFPLPRGGYWKRPYVQRIVDALNSAYNEQHKLPEKSRQRKAEAITGASVYHLSHVIQAHWKPVLAEIEALIGGDLKLENKDA